MSSEEQSGVTDSPWFWVLVFSSMALAALLAIGPKYGRRQANLERKYQARERVAEELSRGNNSAGEGRSDEVAAPRAFASPGDTLVPLWPLAAILILAVLFSAVMLGRRDRGRANPLTDGSTSQ
jgi:hypothetical protein